jgi:hypothetical protein
MASRYDSVPIADFVDLIVGGDDEAMFYLLHQRLDNALRKRFDDYSNNLLDDYEDVIDDFFLYLRENGREPYQPLQRIKKKEAFESWLLSTFRNYLSNRAEAEKHLGPHPLPPSPRGEGEVRGETQEAKIATVSVLIAYALQVSYPRSRFIFLRSLLTMLNKQRAVPDKEMAEALGMSHLSYRVCVHRMKQNVGRTRWRLLHGESLPLDAEHQVVAHRINDDFDHLYPTLFNLYTQSISTLEREAAVNSLRQQYLDKRGIAVHEPNPLCSVRVSINSFWNSLNRWLIAV